MVGRWRVAVGAAVVATFILPACSGNDSVSLQGKDVVDPAKTLERVEKKWRAGLEGKRVTLHDEARCYFSGSSGSESIDDAAYCGPVRHYIDGSKSAEEEAESELQNPDGYSKDLPGSGRWDSYTLNPKAEDDSVEVDVGDLKAAGTTPQSNLTLSRPDGQKPPKDADELAAPPPPPLPSRFSAVMDNFGVKDAVKPKDGRLITPRQTLTVDQIGSVPRVQTDDGVKGPAKGERLVVLQVTLEDGPYSESYDPGESGADTTYAIRIGGDRQKLNLEDRSGSTAAVVASVPNSVQDPELIATAEGKDQAISLRSGDRTSKTAEGFYRSKTDLGVTRQYPSSSYGDGTLDLSLATTFTTAQLTPFEPRNGWAPDGKSWLVLHAADANLGYAVMSYSVRMDWARTMTAKDENGKVVASDKPAEEPGNDQTLGSAVLEVDGAARTFDVTFRPTVLFTARSSGTKPSSGTATLKPLKFKLKFPAR